MRVGRASPTVEIRYPEATGRRGLTLRTGDIFNALARIGPEGLILDLGTDRLPARTQLPVQDGDLLRLQVSDTGPRLTLRLIRHSGPLPALENALRESLPKQVRARAFNRALAAWAGKVRTGSGRLSDASRKAVAGLMDALPVPAEMETAEGVRSVLYRSGLLFEARLRREGSPDASGWVERDLKAGLLRLASQLREEASGRALIRGPSRRPGSRGGKAPDGPSGAVPEEEVPAVASGPELRWLLDQTEGLLARLRVLQVRAAGGEGDSGDWGFEVPVRDGGDLDALHVRVHREGGTGSGGEAAFVVDVRFDLQRAGAMHVRLRCRGRAVSSAWWVEDAGMARAVADALPALEQRLQSAGFQVTAVTCAHGQPEALDEPSGWRSRGLFSERV